MTQAQLEGELARMTGKSRSTIRQRGFSVVEMPTIEVLDGPLPGKDGFGRFAQRVGARVALGAKNCPTNWADL
jgi:hypothetical protein